MDQGGGQHLLVEEHQSLQGKCFHFPPETFAQALSSYGHVYSFSSEGCTKCKWRCTPTLAPPAYHPYQMPMVQNSYTKAVEESDMPEPQFNRQLENYYEWVEKLQQWLGRG